MKIALLFPGQGAQYIGMGKKWFDSYEVAAKTFKECDSVLGLPFPACVLKAMKRN